MIGRVRALPIQVQVFALLLAAPIVVALLGMSLAPLAVEEAMAGERRQSVAAVAGAVRIAVGVVAICASVAAWGAAAILRGSIGALVGRMQDATDAVARGRFRHRIESTRSDELGRLAHAIDLMAARLERLEAARRRMLASVSHELRTPLTIIRGQAFTLSRHEADDSRLQRLELIDHEVMRMNELVEQLVDAASVQASGVLLDRRRALLEEIARDAARRFDAEAAARGIDIVVHAAGAPHEVFVDRQRIEQVLANLIANAVRHADADSTIEIDVGWSSSHAGRHHLEVRNVGAPIRAVDAARIFEPFEQVGARAGRVGLGLAIARSLVEAHGGHLDLVSAGSRTVAFRVELPGAAARVVELGAGERAPVTSVAERGAQR